MSYWKSLPPTPNQIKAIEGYNSAYGVKININNKQDAHNVISVFCPVQKLDFNEKYIEGTDVSYDVVNQIIFGEYKKINENRLRDVVNIKIKDGNAIITTSKRENKCNIIELLNNNVGKLMTEISYSEYEDSLGYLDEQELDEEINVYSNNPVWWK